jgi:hypothetical protein
MDKDLLDFIKDIENKNEKIKVSVYKNIFKEIEGDNILFFNL